jgi:hypothetical protein
LLVPGCWLLVKKQPATSNKQLATKIS